MKVRAKAPFFDGKGLHRKGDIVDVSVFRPELMEMIEEKKVEEIKESVEAPAPASEKAVKKPRKTTRKKA